MNNTVGNKKSPINSGSFEQIVVPMKSPQECGSRSVLPVSRQRFESLETRDSPPRRSVTRVLEAA